MRVLLALVIGLGILIVAGSGVVVMTLLHRMLAPGHGTATPSAAGGAGGAATAMVLLREPDGTRIANVTAADGGLVALLLQGGGEADRVVLLDGDQSGAKVVARVALAPAIPAPRH